MVVVKRILDVKSSFEYERKLEKKTCMDEEKRGTRPRNES